MIARALTPQILDALSDTPVVYLQGARQTGKTTLAQLISREHYPAQYLSLDTAAVMAAAGADPEGFVAGLETPAVVDEIQRVPALALAIKAAVDKRRSPGRFLLTGSASVLSLPQLAQSLAGRVELHTLWPFSQGEIAGQQESLVDRSFAGRLTTPKVHNVTPKDLIRRICLGGFPEAHARKSENRRRTWFDSYVTTILERDVRDLANIERLSDIPRLLALVASRVGQTVNYADLARSLSIPQTTLKRYMTLMETTFLIRLLPAWFSNIGKRLTKAPKLLLVDTGLLSYLLDADSERLRSDRTLLGHVLENFVAMELTKQLGWSRKRCRLFHFRTQTGQEVDLVLEDTSGRLVGIEVKAASRVETKDLKGLETLAELTGDRFLRGLIFYTGESVVPFGKNVHALPIGQLWA
jgi:hypothetical protein